jgi:hypothetical protein
LNPKIIVLYPPHEKFHEMMGATSAPWTTFAAAVQAKLPKTKVVIARPGTVVDAETGEAAEFDAVLRVA